MTSPHLRDARMEDAPALSRLHEQSFARGWDDAEFERLLCDKVVRAHIISHGQKGAPVGFVLSHLVAPEAEILSIAVKGEERRQGLGGILLSHHLRRLAAEGVNISFLEVEEGNAAALKLYASLGYEQIARRKGYYGGTADALVLKRNF
ncbi:ribosomal protein S18-alanine N-acetyltransferase [Xanthobacter sp. TB0139]|uniref:ribosomal protein S18-alanine N-acetyltransferase n=1 Tax=Xanthobacter sp. TB0139 TaxID=3459178 RepID=UPI00403A480C